MRYNFLFVSFIFVLTFLNFNKTFAQEGFIETENINIYFRIGLSYQLGSHQNRTGVNFTSSLGKPYTNISFQYDLLYTLKDLGYFEKSFQHIVGFKLASAFQENSTIYRPFVHSPFTNSYFYEFYYLYRYYFNSWNTHQPTGEIGLNFGHFFLIHENDLLAAKSVDKFRTAAMRLGYQDSVQSIGSSFILWTGNKDHPNTKRINSSVFSRYGYFDLTETPYGKYSHGILSFDYSREISHGNNLRFSAGFDHEKIRNTIQNKFMHDLPVWPIKWNTAKSRHIPMVDDNGHAFLYSPGQKLPKGQFYWNLALNPTAFY